MIRPRSKSYGDISIRTLSPAVRRTHRFRILPQIVARTTCLLSSSTRNIVPGRTVWMRPSTSIHCSFIRYCFAGLHVLNTCRRLGESSTKKIRGMARCPQRAALNSSTLRRAGNSAPHPIRRRLNSGCVRHRNRGDLGLRLLRHHHHHRHEIPLRAAWRR